jgi:hypothetical protein
VGIGGGGDVVGALATAAAARTLGVHAAVGGTTWERRVVDPRPGPRRLDEVEGAERVHAAAALAGPATRGPGGVQFAESHMAVALEEPVALLDPNAGPSDVAAGLASAARALRCDRVMLVDVGGDALAHGDEPGLASPLCDAVMIAAARHVPDGLPVAGAVFGPACDGELTVEEVLARLAEVAAAGGLLGAWGITPESAAELRRAIEHVPTEASAQALACFEGATGVAEIRGGRRRVPRSPVGAVTFYFDCERAMASAARLAAAVTGAPSLEEANDLLHDMGVRTELDLEREAARAEATTY